MRKPLLTTAVLYALATSAAQAGDTVKVGIVFGFTGPIESLTPDMAAAAELAFKEASDTGLFLDGTTIEPIRADSSCVDAAVATAAAERLITADGVAAIIGADCSGVTTAVANNVAVPKGVLLISPSATSPALSDITDNGLFFRTAPSDARQGQVLAEIVKERGIDAIAITYTNNDYGRGLSDSFSSAFEALGGSVVMTASHEDGRADYSAEVGALSASGAEHLAVFGYVDQGGKGIIEASIDAGAFDTFILADGMIGESLTEAFGADMPGSFGTLPGSDSPARATFEEMAKAAGIIGSGPYRGESYDAAALRVLAMQKAGSAERSASQPAVMDVANAPGEKIFPGELEKALTIIAEGGDVDYVGATDVEFTEVGEAAGAYKEVEVKDGAFATLSVR